LGFYKINFDGAFKRLNFDGAFKRNPFPIVFGVIFRDDQGLILYTLVGRLGYEKKMQQSYGI
jgi:hypothetical protein